MKAEIAKAKQGRPLIRIRKLCCFFGLSKSSFYRQFSAQEIKDLEALKVIEKYFYKRRSRDGIRQLKMVIQREEQINFSHKKIQRIKNKYGLVTVIRRKNNANIFLKKIHEHASCANLLDQNFETCIPDQIYSTDITVLGNGHQRAYLAAVKDLCTKEIVGFKVSRNIDLQLSNGAVQRAITKLDRTKKEGLIIHSDQGFHYTHGSYRNMMVENGITQSMSRKGNCLDNAPIESFFGLLKDHLELRKCKGIADIQKEVTAQINYYNKTRPQLGLKKMPPKDYRRHLEK